MVMIIYIAFCLLTPTSAPKIRQPLSYTTHSHYLIIDPAWKQDPTQYTRAPASS